MAQANDDFLMVILNFRAFAEEFRSGCDRQLAHILRLLVQNLRGNAIHIADHFIGFNVSANGFIGNGIKRICTNHRGNTCRIPWTSFTLVDEHIGYF